MIHRTSITVILILLGIAGTAQARRSTGLGVIVGEPTGLSYKQWLGNSAALDGAFAWGIEEGDEVEVQLDLVFHNAAIGSGNGARLPLYYGIGGRVVFEDPNRYGIRIPIGAIIMSSTVPIDLFGEIVPTFDLKPASNFSLSLALGARMFF